MWGEHPWPPAEEEAEALAAALCEILGAGYFESFLALIQAGAGGARERLLRRAGAPWDVDEKRALLHGDTVDDESPEEGDKPEVKTAAAGSPTEEPASPPDTAADGSGQDGAVARTPLFGPDELLIDGQPIQLTGPDAQPSPGAPGRTNGAARRVGRHTGGYGGHTDLDALDRLGTTIVLAYERNRLRRAGVAAEIFDPAIESEQLDALVFDASTPAVIDRARGLSPRFDEVMRRLHRECGVSLEWPGFDIISLDPGRDGGNRPPDRAQDL